MQLAKRLVVNTTTEAGREGAARQLGSTWLCLCGLPVVFSVNSPQSWLKHFSYEGGTIAGGDIHLDGLMLAW